MEKLYLSENELNSLPIFLNPGTMEAKILQYRSTELIKYFYNCSDNKRLTLELLDSYHQELSLVKEFLLYKKEVVTHGDIKGIVIDKGYSYSLKQYIELPTTSFHDKILVLKNIGNVLERLHYLRIQENLLTNFFIGDIHEGNILVNPETKEIQFIDLDSCKIGNNKAFLAKYLQFLKTYNYVTLSLSKKYPKYMHTFSNNENTDLFCFLVIIMKILFSIDIQFMDVPEFYQMIEKLKVQGLPHELYKALYKLYIPCSNTNPYKSLDSIPSSFERKLEKI